jgi:hypothetical protein
MVCPDFFTRADSTTKVAILAFMRKANCISFNLGSVTNLQNVVTQAVAPWKHVVGKTKDFAA